MQKKKPPVAGIGQDETNPLLGGDRLCGGIWLFSRYISVLLQIILNDWRPDVKKGGAECIDGSRNPVYRTKKFELV